MRLWHWAGRLFLIALLAVAGVLVWSALRSDTGDGITEEARSVGTTPSLFAFPDRSITPVSFAVVADQALLTDSGDPSRVVEQINSNDRVRFLTHLGGLAPDTTCAPSNYSDIAEGFGTVLEPVMVTPGESDWAVCGDQLDCEPQACLSALRGAVFANPQASLGANPAEITSQRTSGSSFTDYAENQRWTSHRVVFGTVHMVDEGNGLMPWGDEDDDARLEASTERLEAGLEWLESIFVEAGRADAAGVVVMTHANTLDGLGIGLGFQRFNNELRDLAIEFGKPVLLVQSAGSQTTTDEAFAQPWPDVPNVMRLRAAPAGSDRWYEVVADPTNASVFTVATNGERAVELYVEPPVLPPEPRGPAIVVGPVGDDEPLPVGPPQ